MVEINDDPFKRIQILLRTCEAMEAQIKDIRVRLLARDEMVKVAIAVLQAISLSPHDVQTGPRARLGLERMKEIFDAQEEVKTLAL